MRRLLPVIAVILEWQVFCAPIQTPVEEAESVRSTFERAVSLMAAGDYASAERGFATVIRREPRNVGAIGNLGVLYARTNRADLAVSQYKRALRLSPTDQAIWLNLGLVYLKQERHSLALPAFERAVAIDPQNRQARQLLAVCRLYAGQPALALQDLEELQTANPRDEELLFLLGFAYLKNGLAEKARAVFDGMFEAAGPARTQFLLGKACYEAALFAQSEESFLSVLQLAPDFPGLHLELGKLYISQRRNDDAVRELKAALEQSSANEEASYFLGSLLVQDGRYAEGISYLQRARTLKPDSWAVYFYLGKAKLRLRKAEEAISLLQRAAELNPDEAAAQYQLGRALQASGRKTAAAQAFSHARSLKTDALTETKIPGVR